MSDGRAGFGRQGVLAVLLALLAAGVAPAAAAEAPLKTTLCELLRSPESFNGRMVQVRARVQVGFEWGGLVDPACSAHLLHDRDGFPGLSGRTGQFAYVRSPGRLKGLQWRPIRLPPAVEPVRDDSYRQYEELVSAKHRRPGGSVCFECPLFAITLTVVGRFDHVEEQLMAVRKRWGAKPSLHMAGFGHLGGSRNRLVWRSVSEVVGVPIDPAVYEKRR